MSDEPARSPAALWWCLAAGLVLAAARPVQAEVAVELMQIPAWVERGASRVSISPGDLLQPGDVVITGDTSRLTLRLHEGSRVRLGSRVRFQVERARVEDDKWASFSGLFRVLTGAFRLTTGVLGAQRQRDIDIEIGTVTVGIRGTDIWGRSNADEDLVCLVEGQVEVSRDAQTVALTDPLSLYVAPRGAEPDPVRLVDPQQLAAWAAQTEPNPDNGVLREDGRWVLHLGASGSLPFAESLAEGLRGAGIPAEAEAAEVNATTWYRVVVRGFVTRAGALAAGRLVRDDQGLPEPWVSQPAADG